jgi:hypothetical protein
MSDKTRDDFMAFLEEYETLIRKHKIMVCSCGCCDSPWLLEDHVQHLASDLPVGV